MEQDRLLHEYGRKIVQLENKLSIHYSTSPVQSETSTRNSSNINRKRPFKGNMNELLLFSHSYFHILIFILDENEIKDETSDKRKRISKKPMNRFTMSLRTRKSC